MFFFLFFSPDPDEQIVLQIVSWQGIQKPCQCYINSTERGREPGERDREKEKQIAREKEKIARGKEIKRE